MLAHVQPFISFLPLSVVYPSPPSSPTADSSCSTSPPPQSTSLLRAASHPPRYGASRVSRPSPSPPAISPGPAALLLAKTLATNVLSPARRHTTAHSNQT